LSSRFYAYLRNFRDVGFPAVLWIRIRDEQPESYFLKLKNIFLGKIGKFFDADPGSGMEKIRIRDGKKSDPGYGMEKTRIRDKHPGSATLILRKGLCRNFGVL
jgi:hypothetical protein